MQPETTFRGVLAAGFVATLLIGGYHRVRSWQSKEALDRRQEGLLILVTLRPVALLLWAGVFAYLINPVWMSWSSLPLPEWLRWTGVGVFAIGLGLFAWTLRALGTNLTDTVVTRKAHTLITHGPYRWVASSILRRDGVARNRNQPHCGELVHPRDRCVGFSFCSLCARTQKKSIY